MIINNIELIFKYDYGLNALTKTCSQAVLGIEFVGDVEDDIDYNLIEDYDGVRVTLKVNLKVHKAESLWFAAFLASDSKVIEIEGEDVEVVNDMKGIDFELWEDLNYASEVEMRFRRKSLGLLTFMSTSSAETNLVTS